MGLAVLGVVATVIGVYLLMGGGGDAAPRPSARPSEAADPVAAYRDTSRVITRGTTTTTSALHDDHAHEEGDGAETYPSAPPLPGPELAAAIGNLDPGFPAEVARAAADVGAAVLVADLTGAGRERWPSFWGEGQHRPRVTSVTVHAAGVTREPPADLGEEQAMVRVLWSAEGSGLYESTGQWEETRVYLVLTPIGWAPREVL